MGKEKKLLPLPLPLPLPLLEEREPT